MGTAPGACQGRAATPSRRRTRSPWPGPIPAGYMCPAPGPDAPPRGDRGRGRRSAVPGRAAPTATAVRPLPDQDSNLDSGNQNPICCQLHHPGTIRTHRPHGGCSAPDHGSPTSGSACQRLSPGCAPAARAGGTEGGRAPRPRRRRGVHAHGRGAHTRRMRILHPPAWEFAEFPCVTYSPVGYAYVSIDSAAPGVPRPGCRPHADERAWRMQGRS